MLQILIIDDDKNIRRYLKTILLAAGYTPICTETADEALHIMETNTIALIILDIMMHTAKQLPDDIKTGFLAGADDYMTKPADEDVLLLRIKALLRRAKITAEHQLRIGHTILNYDALTVTTDKDTQLLPQKEFLLLYKLLSYPNQIFTRMQLMDDIWGPDSDSGDATVSVHINRLRNRFQNCHDFSITTIRGLGYKAQVQEALM